VGELLHSEADEMWSLSGKDPTAPMSTSYRGAVEHFDRMRALLDIVGWDAEDGDKDVAVDLNEHTDALYGALSSEMEDLHAHVLPDEPTTREAWEPYFQLRELREQLDARIEVTA
jgi:hypothetical protein